MTTTPLDGVPYTSTDPDDITAHLRATNGGTVDWTPALATVDIGNAQTFNQPVGAGLADEAGLWGNASYAWTSRRGDLVEAGFRMVMGTMIDETFDAGDGYAAITLPADPYAEASGVGYGWVFIMDGSFATVKKSCQFIVDPPYSATKAIIAPDGTSTFSSFDPSNDPPPAYLVAPTGPPTMVSAKLVVIAGRLSYRKA